MVYMGSKMGISDKLIPFLQKIIDENGIVEYWEPFVGGANVIDKIRCDRRVGVDKMYHLIALLEKARDDINGIPKSCSKEEFNLARDIYRGKSSEKMEAWRLGAYAYLGSYSAKGFIGSYCVDKKTGRDIYGERLKNLSAQAPSLIGIDFKACDYRELEIPDGALIYCDPPYFGTTEYQYASEGKFDHKIFWNWAEEIAKRCFVVVSEETFPDGWTIVKEIPKRRTVGKGRDVAMEKIGIY